MSPPASVKSIAQRVRTVSLFVMSFSLSRSPCHSTLDSRPFSLEHFIRPVQHRLRDRQAYLLGSFQIDQQLKLRRLLDRQIDRLGALENFVHVDGSAPEQVSVAGGIRHQAPGFYVVSCLVHRRQSVLYGKFRNLLSVTIEQRIQNRNECISAPLDRTLK